MNTEYLIFKVKLQLLIENQTSNYHACSLLHTRVVLVVTNQKHRDVPINIIDRGLTRDRRKSREPPIHLSKQLRTAANHSHRI